ncbi:MAG: hypothetical protein ABJN34_12850 [Litoreibacter sp.]|uniref:hypothetical protein n=1 Tax=Litoreibacter sp. TaxID=1969459 RepID=UPI003298625B
MSDPVTNVDVEDVLSSIRRLVSDTNSEDRQASNAPEAPEPKDEDTPKGEPKVADALVLTSALRVNSGAEDSGAEDSVPEFRHTDMSNLRSTILDESSDDEDSSAQADEADWAALDDDEYYEDEVPVESAPVIDFIRHGHSKPEAETPDDGQSDEAEEAAPADEWEVTVASDEGSEDAAKADAAEEWVDEPQNDTELGVAEEIVEHDEIEAVSEAEAEAEAEVDDVIVDAEQDQIQPNETAEPMTEEAEFASVAAATVMDEEQEPAEDDFDLSNLDDSNFIDEDALRDLVAEIVRQELSGDLGERITRNVRKLVRREIHRALLTREFE